jgi:hypothetical protein
MLTTGEIVVLLTATQTIPYESLGVVGLLAIAVVTLWLLNGKLAKQVAELQELRATTAEAEAARAEERAVRSTEVVQENSSAFRANANAMTQMTKAFEANSRMVEKLLDRLERGS